MFQITLKSIFVIESRHAQFAYSIRNKLKRSNCLRTIFKSKKGLIIKHAKLAIEKKMISRNKITTEEILIHINIMQPKMFQRKK